MEEEVKVELPEAVCELVDIADGMGTLVAQWSERRDSLLAGTTFYTPDQMRAYARAAMLAERERAAQIAESQPRCDPMDAEIIAAAIRKGN